MLYRHIDGSFYVGDMQPGDREATQEEIDTHATNAEAEVKKTILAKAMIKRDMLLVHLERLRTRAIEGNNTTARDALSTAIASLENIFNDQRVIDAIDGDVTQVLDTAKDEIGIALAQASPATYYALLALDAL